MIRRAKGFELMKIIFIIDLSTFAQKSFFFKTKVVYVYVIKGMNYNIHDIKSNF